ncbi:MAG: hypothetical protein Q9191_005398, partial [Dirinaria sp. TL-2023a]
STQVLRKVSERLGGLEPIINQICEISCSPGLSIGVLHHGEVIHKVNYGYRDIAAKTPPGSDTLYSINSMTKALTAAAVGVLVEDGLLRWDTPVHTILPDFGKGHGEIGRKMTIVDLLSHRSGVISPDTFFFQDYNEVLLRRGQEIETFNYANQEGFFRASFIYSNFGYGVAGLVVEKLSGMEFGCYLRTKIFDPLHLERTTTDDVSNDDNFGVSYCVLEDRELYPVPPPKVKSETALEGAAGVKSTVNDLLHLYQVFMETCNTQIQLQSTCTDGSPFKQCPTLIKAHNSMEGSTLREHAYGLGWVRCQLPGVLGKLGINGRLQMDLPTVGVGGTSRLRLYHEGLMPGSTTNVYTFPERMTAIVVLQSAVALNDCPDWISQLLVETVFDVPQRNDFIQLAQGSAKRMLALVPSMASKLSSERVENTRPSLDLGQYVGRYFNPIKTFFVEVTQQADESISEICRRFRAAPRRIQRRVEHVVHLADTARLIEQHYSLQTTNLKTQVRSTLELAKSLSAISISKENEILAKLDQLEKEKSSLLLCISLVHMDLLGDIQGGVGKLVTGHVAKMPERQDSQKLQVVDIESSASKRFQTSSNEKPKQRSETESMLRDQVKGLSVKDEVTSNPQKGNLEHQFTDIIELICRADKTPNEAREYEDDTNDKPTPWNYHHSYEKNSSECTAWQMNGDASGRERSGLSSKHRYKDVTARGFSRQFNGNINDPEMLKTFLA